MTDADVLERELPFWPGAHVVEVIPGRKHRKTVLGFDGKPRYVVSSSSPSDSRRGPLNHCKTIRKVLRELGATRIVSASVSLH